MKALLQNNVNVFELVELRDKVTKELVTGLSLTGQVFNDAGASVAGPFAFAEHAPGRFVATQLISGLTLGGMYKVVISAPPNVEIIEWVPAMENTVE